jgi:hypothetical protein
MRRAATLSPDGRYRYTLSRQWSETPRRIAWVMLNPSYADGERDDQTVRKIVEFSIRDGAGSLDVVNLMAAIETNPIRLAYLIDREFLDAVGPGNAAAISGVLARADRIVLAWGASPLATPELVASTLAAADGRELSCLGRSKSGAPRHPSRLAYSTPFSAWSPA